MKLKLTGGGGEDPKKGVFTSQEEINRANEFARALLRRQNVNPGLIANTYVARNVGDKMPTWEISGKPPLNPIVKATILPTGVTLKDVVSSKDGYGYFHPQSGNWIPVDIQAITQRYGQIK